MNMSTDVFYHVLLILTLDESHVNDVILVNMADLPAHLIRGRGRFPANYVRGLRLRARAFEQRPLVHVRSGRLQEAD